MLAGSLLSAFQGCLKFPAHRRSRDAPGLGHYQYLAAMGNSSAGNNEITRQPLLVTTTSSSMRAAE
jgi:hypothetical protein